MRVRVGHISLQFSDTNAQHTQDIENVFKRAKNRKLAWITGTEAGPGKGRNNTADELVRIGPLCGYRTWVPSVQHGRGDPGSSSDAWLAVREDLIDSNWKTDYLPVIPTSSVLEREHGLNLGKKKWSPKGLASVSWHSNLLGDVDVSAAHYLTGARRPSDPLWVWNKKLADALDARAERVAAGDGLAFYGGDQNMADNKNDEPQGDTFFENDFTSAWDELSVWQGTGHGCIDVIASYNDDLRVRARSIRSLPDSDFPLHTDHFFVEAVFDIDPPVTTAPRKSIRRIALEVLDGKWGNGDERRARLTEAGYDYDVVQAKVAQLVAPPPVEEEPPVIPPVQTLHHCPLCLFEHNGVVRTSE